MILRAADQRKMPWKNGLGVTTEIMISPPDAGLTNFDWRVSMATVASDGGFSSFTDVERTLTVLSGDGLSLVVSGAAPVILTQSTPPHRFPADAPTHATLLGQAVVDLNVMTRRGVWQHQVSRLSYERFPDYWSAESEVSIWFCTGGDVTFDDGADFQLTLQTGDAVCVRSTHRQPIQIEAPPHAGLILIELHRTDG